MKKEPTPKRKVLRVKMPLKEYDHVVQQCSCTTCRSLSEYVRKLLAGKPIRIYYRNKSFDQFIDETILLREEMELIRTSLPFSNESEVRLACIILETKEKINQLFDHVCKDQNL